MLDENDHASIREEGGGTAPVVVVKREIDDRQIHTNLRYDGSKIVAQSQIGASDYFDFSILASRKLLMALNSCPSCTKIPLFTDSSIKISVSENTYSPVTVWHDARAGSAQQDCRESQCQLPNSQSLVRRRTVSN
jgi:hypothetical protein